MSGGMAPTRQASVILLIGIMGLSIPASLTPALATGLTGQADNSLPATNITTTPNPAERLTAVLTPLPNDTATGQAIDVPNAREDRPDTAHVRRVRRILADSPRPRPDRVLDAATVVLEARQTEVVANHTDKRMETLVASQRTNLRSTRELMDILDSDRSNNIKTFDQAVRLATVGMKLQLAQRRTTREPLDPMTVTLPATLTPTHTSPSGAAFALLEQHNVTPTVVQAAEIRALDDLPEPTRSDLTEVLDAYIAYDRVTQEVFVDRRQSRLPTPGQESGVHAGEGNISVAELARVRAAQRRLVGETADLRAALRRRPPILAGPASHGPLPAEAAGVQVAPVLSINLSTHRNHYTTDYALLLDQGGDDTYDNNAGGGGGNLTNPMVAAALIDLGGADEYHGRNGGGHEGVGFLVDAGNGSDTYVAGDHGTNGGGFSGVGFLLDGGGGDTYVAGGSATNGGGRRSGTGFLLDAGTGDDTYEAGSRGTNGGVGGVDAGRGFLLDAGGNDSYVAGDRGTNGGGQTDGYQHGGPGGGYLVDASGNDTYTAGDTGTNGGVSQSAGFLFDAAGADLYIAGTGGTNGGSNCVGIRNCPGPGVGILLDGGGADNYNYGGDEFIVRSEGLVGLKLDLPVTSKLTRLPVTPMPATSTPPSTPTPTEGVLHVEGTCDSYDDDGTTGSAEDDDGDAVYGHIQSAVDAAASGSTIEAHTCIYNERVVVETADLVIRAGSQPVIDGQGARNPGVEIRAANVTLRGFVIRNFNSTGTFVSGGTGVSIQNNTYNNTEGLYVENSSTSHILSNTIERDGGSGAHLPERPSRGSGRDIGIGIHVIRSPHSVLRNNTVDEIGCCVPTGAEELGADMLGIYVESTSHATIQSNAVIYKTFGHSGASGIVVRNISQSSIRNNTIAVAMRGVLVYGTTKTVIQSNTITTGDAGIIVAGSSCTGGATAGSCRSGDGRPSEATIIQSNSISESDGGIVITNAGNTTIRNNTLSSTAIILHGQEGHINNTTIISNIISNTKIGIRVTGAADTLITSNTVTSTHIGIWTGFRTNLESYLRDFRSAEPGGSMDGQEQRPTIGTVIRDNTIRRAFNGTFISPGSSPRVVSNQFIENKRAIHLNQSANPVLVDIQANYFQGNVKYSIYNGNDDVVLNASQNEWAGGLPASPSNNSEDNPIRDPFSGVLANESSGAVSEGTIEGVSNVHFCANSRDHCLDPPTVENLSPAEVETTHANAEFDVQWRVSDPGDNLETVELGLVDDTDGETEDTASMKVSDGNASRTTRLVAPREDGSGHNYTVKLTVTDEYGSTATETVSVPETEPQTPTATATTSPTPTPPLATNGTGGGSGTGPGGSGAGGTGGSGSKSTSGASSDAISQESTPSDEKQTVTKTAPPTPTETPTEPPRVTPTPEIVPGFGVVGWLVALVLLVGLFARRRQ